MQIPAHQIFNVLNAFTSQLFRVRDGQKTDRQISFGPDSTAPSAESKRQAAIARVAADIVTRIGRFGLAETKGDLQITGAPERRRKNSETFFRFNVIDTGNRKTTHQFAANDPRFIIEQLEQAGRGR